MVPEWFPLGTIHSANGSHSANVYHARNESMVAVTPYTIYTYGVPKKVWFPAIFLSGKRSVRGILMRSLFFEICTVRLPPRGRLLTRAAGGVSWPCNAAKHTVGNVPPNVWRARHWHRSLTIRIPLVAAVRQQCPGAATRLADGCTVLHSAMYGNGRKPRPYQISMLVAWRSLVPQGQHLRQCAKRRRLEQPYG